MTTVYWEVMIAENEQAPIVRLCQCKTVEAAIGVVRSLLDLGGGGPLLVQILRKADLGENKF